ncbi:hypothetical protein HanIR_Chr05g0236081 [Helianthus annuus]|nr:hypothetical protein HanIR_Chr05g0236081 [Helianthus annuus]
MAEVDRMETGGREGRQKSFLVASFRVEVAKKIGTKVNVGRFKWNAWVLRKVLFCVEASIGVHSIEDGAETKGVNTMNKLCVICGVGAELVDQLATSCIMMRSVWWYIFIWLNIPNK